MLFNSVTFLIFFAIVLALHHMPFSWRVRKFNLLIASYLFYAAWNPPFVLLIWISTAVDWFAAGRMARCPTRQERRPLLVLSILVNLGILGYFKYGGFVLQNFVSLLELIGINYSPPQWSIVLPVGISFYTFQTMSYTIDVYRGRIQPCRSMLDFALFVTFFPQLVAGPIVRASEFLPQCATPRRASSRQLSWGLSLLTVGLFQKIVIADGLMAPISDRGFAAGAPLELVDAWGAALAFSVQVFSDFAGYSTCAIGAALCLGFSLPENFHYPFASAGCTEFWQRWHITLSRWLRDYLFVPLGGYRHGRRRAFVNLMVTMLLCGLWHGASWNFVLFGAMHGLLIAGDRLLRPFTGKAGLRRSRWGEYLLCGVTCGFFCFTAAVFRASTLSHAFGYLKGMVALAGAQTENTLSWEQDATAIGVFLVVFNYHWYMRKRTLQEVAARWPWWLRGILLGLCLASVSLLSGSDRAFIYFQF